MAAHIDAGTSIVTVITALHTTPENQEEVAALQEEFTEQVVIKQPGMISGSFHASRDGLRVVTYAQWASEEQLQAMLANEDTQARHAQVEGLLEAPPDVHFYEVVATIGEAPTEIRPGASPTVIALFNTTLENQQMILDMTDATGAALSREPGFISASLHKERDGLRVLNYVQWESVAAFEKASEVAVATPAFFERTRRSEALAGPADLHIYDVRSAYAGIGAVVE